MAGLQQPTNNQNTNVFIAKLNASGTGWFMLHIWGSKTDLSRGIGVDSAGNAYVTGEPIHQFPNRWCF